MYVRRVVLVVVLAAGRAVDDGVLVVGNGIEDLAYGANEVELDDGTPEDALLAKDGRSV